MSSKSIWEKMYWQNLINAILTKRKENMSVWVKLYGSLSWFLRCNTQVSFFALKLAVHPLRTYFFTASVISNRQENQPTKILFCAIEGIFVRKNLRNLKKEKGCIYSDILLLICNNRIIRDWKFRCRRLISGFGEYKTFIRINSLPLNFLKKYFVQKIMEQTTVKKSNYLEKRRSDVSWLSVLVTFSDCFVKVIFYVYDVVRNARLIT